MARPRVSQAGDSRREEVRVAAYYRMSSDRQEASIPAQRKAVTQYAKDHGYRIVKEYVDEGISGDATEKRLAFQRMTADAGRGDWSCIVCWDQDRFGRFDPIEGGYWIKPLRDAGVRLETVAQGVIDWTDFAGRIVWSVQQEAKHAYLRDLSRNVLRGHIENALQGGRRAGMPPFGYDAIGDDLVPNGDAETVKRIFRGVLQRESLRSIARELGTTRRGKRWSANAVRVIIRNPVYRGAYVWGRRKTGKYHRFTNGRIEKANADCNGEMVIIEDHHQQLVTPEEWHEAQRRLSENQTATAPRGTFLFSGLVVCGHCGGKAHGATMWGHRYYLCVNRGRGCRYYSVRESELVAIIVAQLEKAIGTPKARAALEAAYAAKVHRNRQSVDVAKERKRLTAIDEKLAVAAERLFEVDAALLPIAQQQAKRLKEERDALAMRIEAAVDAERRAAVATKASGEMLEAMAMQLASLHSWRPDATRRFFREMLVSLAVQWSTAGTPRLARHNVSRVSLRFRSDVLGDL